MPDNSTAAAYNQGATTPALPSKQIPSHTEKLHLLAQGLVTCNGRLSAFLERMTGPTPAQQLTGKGADTPGPTGALLVAQFGAERISQQINILSEQINHLENLG